MEVQAETIRYLKSTYASQAEVRQAIENYAAERVRWLKSSNASQEEVKEAVAKYVGLLASPLISVSSAEDKLSALQLASAPQVDIDAATAQYNASVEAEQRARVEAQAVRAQKGPQAAQAEPAVTVHTTQGSEVKSTTASENASGMQHLAPQRQGSDLEGSEPKRRMLETKANEAELTIRPLSHPVAPHVFLGFCDIGMVGCRLLNSAVPSGNLQLLSEETVRLSSAFDACWKGLSPFLLRTFGRDGTPEVSLLIVNTHLQGQLVPLVSHALVELLSSSSVQQVTVLAGAYMISPAPAHTVHWSTINCDKTPDICNKCQLAQPLSSLASLKDSFLSSLAFFLRISAIPCVFLLMSAKRYHAGQDDGTAPLLQTLGDLISRATSPNATQQGLMFASSSTAPASRVHDGREESGFYL